MKLFTILLAALLLNGCSAYKIWYGSEKPVMSYVFFNDDGTVTEKAKLGAELKGYIVTWSPEFNGAFVSNTGKGCVQPAIYAKTDSGEVSIPTEVFSNISGSGNLSAEYAEALEKLVSVTDQSTFLSIGMYGICQLSAADLMTKEQTAEVVKILFEKAANAKGSNGSAQNSTKATTSVTSQQ